MLAGSFFLYTGLGLGIGLGFFEEDLDLDLTVAGLVTSLMYSVLYVACMPVRYKAATALRYS